MTQRTLLALGAGAVFGALLFNAAPAIADMPTIDITTDSILTMMQSAVTGAISSMEKSVTNAITDISNPDSVSALLRNGFTQNANYAKAQVGAQQQIADASNTAMARFHRDMRNAGIRDEHTPNAQACISADTGQVVEAASLMGWRSAESIAAVTDPRGEALPQTPAYNGTGQAMSAAAQLHLQRYCSATESDAGLCTVSARQNFDQRASSLFGADNLLDENGVNTANDFGTNLIQPVPPAALRSDQLNAVGGQDAATRRRAYNARMSLARSVINYAIGIQTPSVQLTQAEQQEMTNEGIPVAQSSSWLQVISLEVNRRVADIGWATTLQTMPPASVEREIATELALSTYLQFQNFRIGLLNASLSATRLAMAEEQAFRPETPIPTPSPAPD
jgi:hypothetical protein